MQIFRPFRQVLLFLFLVLIGGCVTQFIPDTTEDQDLLVVEGLITDQPGQNKIKISTSTHLGERNSPKPLVGCNVTISDDEGNNFNFNETSGGTYVADPSFHGVIGRSYALHIYAGSSRHNLSYQSAPVLLKPVPAIDSVYYERRVFTRMEDGSPTGEGCQIFLDTHDPSNNCKFYRWEYVETWEFSLPYLVPNSHCWVTDYSDNINIKNTTSLSESIIVKLPLDLVTNATDRLKERYSILVNQYSITEEEYLYWEKLQNVVEQVGSLYDLTPATIPSNIVCVENPDEKVLGYFSVSGVQSRRIFIKEFFRGIADLYKNCEHAVIDGSEVPPDLGNTVWIIIDHQSPPSYRVLTYTKGCADCTVRGTTVEPDFWRNSK
jgi:hypothetical protein